MDNLLEKYNDELDAMILDTRQEVIKKREKLGYTPIFDYFFEKLKQKIIFSNKEIPHAETIEVEFISRERYSSDVAVKIPKLIKDFGTQKYIESIIPAIIFNLKGSDLFENEIEKIEAVGIYVNLKINIKYFIGIIDDVLKFEKNYGFSDVNKNKKIVLDYSSPNMAKHLHAGHVRSTIIGEVLAKIYEATGFTVHRLNYLNDWGGMGALIEAYIRSKENKPALEDKYDNDFLDNLYQLIRKAEKIYKSNNFEEDVKKERPDLLNIIGEFSDHEDYKKKYDDFKNNANKRFIELENGSFEEFGVWKMMKDWSLREFNKFYDLLNIKHDYLIGESFYSKKGREFVAEKITTGEVIHFVGDVVDSKIKKLQSLFVSGSIKKTVLDKKIEEINNDVGAYVIMLPSGSRLVIMRSDGASIYATRDLVSIKHRIDTFSPNKLIYEVGQEQSEHFKNIFEATLFLKMNNDEKIDLKHISHGFYIDAETGQKLSSREGAQNIIHLIEESIKYFREKYNERAKQDKDPILLTEDEKDTSAKMLAVGSIAFNDIKQDKRFPISFHKNILENIKSFEESGGAYIMYSIARANSIIRKSDKKISDIETSSLDLSKMEIGEIELLKKVADLPRVVLRSSETDNPAYLAEYLLRLANDYNSYYENYDVLSSGKLEYPYRLFITHTVATALSNGMKICHAEAPERI